MTGIRKELETFIIQNLDDARKLHTIFCDLRSKGFVLNTVHYRGEQKYRWDIKPGIFRPPLKVDSVELGKQLERDAILEFERVVKEEIGENVLREIYNKNEFGREWDLLFQAQHAGVKTTLTDWSMNYHTALYFATEKSKDVEIEKSNAQLWCFLMPNEIHKNVDLSNGINGIFHHLDPFAIDKYMMIDPSTYLNGYKERLFEYRWFKQRGKFLISPNSSCNIPFNEVAEFKDLIYRIRIPAECKPIIRKELEEFDRRYTREEMYIEESEEAKRMIDKINDKIFGV